MSDSADERMRTMAERALGALPLEKQFELVHALQRRNEEIRQKVGDAQFKIFHLVNDQEFLNHHILLVAAERGLIPRAELRGRLSILQQLNRANNGLTDEQKEFGNLALRTIPEKYFADVALKIGNPEPDETAVAIRLGGFFDSASNTVTIFAGARNPRIVALILLHSIERIIPRNERAHFVQMRSKAIHQELKKTNLSSLQRNFLEDRLKNEMDTVAFHRLDLESSDQLGDLLRFTNDSEYFVHAMVDQMLSPKKRLGCLPASVALIAMSTTLVVIVAMALVHR